MKSARRSAYLKRKERKSLPSLWRKRFILPILGLFLILIAFLVVVLNKHFWDGRNKFAFVFPDDNGNVGVTVLEPAVNEMATMVIPGDTEVLLAMNYGMMRIKNVWQLGINEKFGGQILVKTIAKNFSFPVFLWSDELGRSVGKNNLPNLFKFVFFPKMTNIAFGDRISVALFSLKVKNLNKTEIDLAKSQFVVKQTLTDGESGFIIPGETSGRLTVYFTDNDFIKPALTGKNIKIYIVDSTGRSDISQEVGRIFEVMGGKVVSIDKSQGVRGFVCEISGRDKELVKKVVNLFGCKGVPENTDFDLEVRLGSEFSKTF